MTTTLTDDERPDESIGLESQPISAIDNRQSNVDQNFRRAITIFVVGAATLFVIWNLRPWLWITDSTPTGGDLGAHVWSPAFLRDELLPHFRLSGWTSDWYAGFPAFTFYMVLPSLLVVIVNVGLSGPLPILASVVIAVGAIRARTRWGNTPSRIAAVYATAGLLWLLSVPISYGIAMKLVVVLGLVTLPICAWSAGKLGGLAFPGPAMLSVASLLFIFDRSFNIYGGNLMSTMAGEFAFSMSLSLAMLYVGFAARGMQTGRHRGLAAALLAASGLSHLFPAFFAIAFTAAFLVVRPGRRAVRWLMVTGPVAFLLAAFWVLPFIMNRAYLNDMGWGKERRYVQALWSRSGSFGDQSFLSNSPMLQLFVTLAIAGAVISGLRRVKFGMAMSIVAMTFAALFVILPEGRLWNVRIVPFYYLAVYLMAGVAISEIARGAGHAVRKYRASRRVVADSVSGGLIVLTLAVIVVFLGLPMRSLPGGHLDASTGTYSWLGLSTKQLNLGPGWVEYNFRGYEDKAATSDGGGTPEYVDIVATMKRVGDEFGCGRALWEFDSGRLGSYGTPMSPMLLPHWTDRCIGSMEGLYFEASATTPYHFLMQSEFSAAPSRAQRDLPYSGLDVAAGVDHLKDLGVRYYMAFSETALQQARSTRGLTEIANSGPWVVFKVEDSSLVTGLSQLPVVLDGADAGGEDWLIPSVGNFTASGDTPLIAATGPQTWPRASLADLAESDSEYVAAVENGDRASLMRYLAGVFPEWLPSESAGTVAVSNIDESESSISFDVDQIGSPVLVHTSYFPNWQVSGADGPYRVSPNLMVVIPTSTHVRLNYGRSMIEVVSIVLTLMGIVALAFIGKSEDGREGRAIWDLTHRSTGELPDRETVISGARTFQLGPTEIGEIRAKLESRSKAFEVGFGLSAAAILFSIGMSVFINVHADAAVSSMLVWAPAAVGLVALVFKFAPEMVSVILYRRRVLAPAELIADLMDGLEPADPWDGAFDDPPNHSVM